MTEIIENNINNLTMEIFVHTKRKLGKILNISLMYKSYLKIHN